MPVFGSTKHIGRGVMYLLVLASLVAAAAAQDSTLDPVARQLEDFNATQTGPIGVLRTMHGSPVQRKSVVSHLNRNLIRSEYFLDPMTHLLAERIPERILHAKGAAAFGYFEVTHDVTNLTKAKFLDTIGKRTRVAVRFSPATLKKGASDLSYNLHGFAVKFYTEDGNLDLPGFTVPVFVSRDPGVTHSFVHAVTPNPVTNLVDSNQLLDFLVNHPSAFQATLMSLTPMGLPASYRTVNGFNIHTLQLANSCNETSFSRFYFTPDLGVQNLTVGSTSDNSYLTRDLYNAIGLGNYPSWTVWMQPLTMSDVIAARNRGEDVFDVTRTLSTETYPLQQIGNLVLNENPTNYFAQVEQLSFCPGNLVPGIVGEPDKLFEGRIFAYRTTQIHRLGINFNKIPVNQPNVTVYSYNRDGNPPVNNNEGGAPNYYPNAFNGPEPVADHQPDIIEIDEVETSNIDQVSAFYSSLSEADKEVTINNVAQLFTFANEIIKERTFAFFAGGPAPIQEFGSRVLAILDNTTATTSTSGTNNFFPIPG